MNFYSLEVLRSFSRTKIEGITFSLKKIFLFRSKYSAEEQLETKTLRVVGGQTLLLPQEISYICVTRSCIMGQPVEFR